LNLSYTDIRAPFDGVIGNRRAWSGSFVSSGTQLLSLVPAHGLWIDANFKENQLAHMRAGQPVTIVADVLPNHTFKGHVASLAPALEGDGAKLDVLRPGLSVIVTVNEKSPR
ncbi:HlyD family secretion protein, partial [Klebsiella pneumoniae]